MLYENKIGAEQNPSRCDCTPYVLAPHSMNAAKMLKSLNFLGGVLLKFHVAGLEGVYALIRCV